MPKSLLISPTKSILSLFKLMDSYWPHNYDHNNHHYQHHQEQVQNDPLQQQLRGFWESQSQEGEQAVDFKSHGLPFARIKKIMKSDENVRLISAEAPVLLAKACEMFIQDLSLRSWSCTREGKRRTLQKADIGAALFTTDILDFLVDIVPREKLKPVTIRTTHQLQQPQQGYSKVGESAGLNMGLQMQLVPVDDHMNQAYVSTSEIAQAAWPSPSLSHRTAWPPMQRPPDKSEVSMLHMEFD